jgi:hypothetical protein
LLVLLLWLFSSVIFFRPCSCQCPGWRISVTQRRISVMWSCLLVHLDELQWTGGFDLLCKNDLLCYCILCDSWW